MAYSRACKRELNRQKHWQERVARRKANILQILKDCSRSCQKSTERNQFSDCLISSSEENAVSDSEFYNHIIHERKKRKWK